jgi:glutamine synthetase adenylyltransferase
MTLRLSIENVDRLPDGGPIRIDPGVNGDAVFVAAFTIQALSNGYAFLRRLDLRLRIVHDYTIDHLPTGPALQQLARRLGHSGEDPAARLRADYERVTGAVRAAFSEVVR